QKKRRCQVLEIGKIFSIQIQGDAQLFLGGSEVAFLEVDAPQAAVQLRVVGSEHESLLKRGNRIIPFLGGNQHVRAQLERLECGLLASVQAIEFRKGLVVLFLLHEEMDEPSAGFGI